MDFYPELVTHKAFFDVVLDYQELSKKRSKIIRNELEQRAFHPDRVNEWSVYFEKNGGKPCDFDWVF
jgi:hypothetical protein